MAKKGMKRPSMEETARPQNKGKKNKKEINTPEEK